MDWDIFKNKKILVTGHTGFKWSWLIRWLSLLVARVVGISKDIPTYPSNYEVDTFELFNLLEKEGGYSISLPIILNNKEMEFVKWKLFDPLKVNSFGFLEPIKKNKIVYPDLFLLPLLAFDRFHNRLGYGKGYYDRFLKKYVKNNKKATIIGLAFSFQKYKKIPTSMHDVKLNYILTEKGLF